MKRDERRRLWRMYRHRPPASIRARLVEYLDGPFTLRSHLRLLASPGDETRHRMRAILDALEVEDSDPIAVAAMADGAPWIALRGGWAGELAEPASRLVNALGMTFTEEEIRLYDGIYADGGPFDITDEQLDRMEDHAVADSRFTEGMATPEGMALWADVVAADFLVKEASRLRVRTTGEEAASVLLARARARWQRFEDDPDGMATTAIAKAAAEHGYPQLSHQLSHQPTRMADLWSSWSPLKEPLGKPLSRAELPSPMDAGLGLQSLNFGEQIETGGKIEWPEARWLAFRRRAPLVVQLLAWVWWHGRWKEHAEGVIHKPSALVRPVYSALGAYSLRPAPVRSLTVAGERQVSLPGLRPAFEAGDAALRDAMKAASRVSPITCQRFTRSVVQWGTWADLAGEQSEVIIREEGDKMLTARRTAGGVEIVCRSGGLKFLASAIGQTSNSTSVADVLDVFAGYGAAWNTPKGRGKGPLLHWSGRYGEAGKVAITLTELLLPGVAGNNADPLTGDDRWLIPVIPMPDLSGLPNRALAQLCGLDWLAMEVFAQRRAELVEHGSVALDWGSMARTVGFAKRSKVPLQALEKWVLEPGEKLAPSHRWVRVEGARGALVGRFTLVQRGAEGAALRFIMEGGFRIAHGRKKGKASVKRRKARR
jgi:hypothetical protein